MIDLLNNLNKVEIKESVRHIHFIGIGGVGMCGIAEILLHQGYKISGSDMNENRAVKALAELGIRVAIGHHEKNISKDIDLVVTSSAIASTNPEVQKANELHIPIIPRAKMLAQIMNKKKSIAVAGTHGKTTTTSLVASVLEQSGFEPTFVIGGLLHAAGTNAKIGNGDYVVAEADESDASFLYLNPDIAIVTNIDADHLWFYNDNFETLKETFIHFLEKIPDTGYALVCIDDDVVREIMPKIKCKVITYGFSDDADWRICDFKQDGINSHFHIIDEAKINKHQFTLHLPGQHNVENAAAAAIIALKAGAEEAAINTALQEFQGTGRRFQIHGEFDFDAGKALVIDDYGHHPREIAATYKALKAAWPDKRLVVAFQPQRYSRTKALFNEFSDVLATMDNLILLDIFPAGEKPLKGADGKSLLDAISKKSKNTPLFITRDTAIKTVLTDYLKDGDVLLMQGAGDVGAMAKALVEPDLAGA